MGQVAQPDTRLVQAREGGHPRYRPLQQVLLSRGRGRWAGQDVFQGRQQEAEWAALGAVRESSGGVPRHGHQPGLPDAPGSHVHVRAAQAGPFRILRQALGVGGRHPHGANRVPYAQLNKRQPRHIPNYGTWKKGGTTSFARKVMRNPHRYKIGIAHQPNLVMMPEATLYQRAKAVAPHEQTPAWARHTDSTPRAPPVS